MITACLALTESYRSQFGDIAVDDLETQAHDQSTACQKFLAELAAHLRRDNLHRLDDAPVGWRWPITLPDTAAAPDSIWRQKMGNMVPEELRNARQIRGTDWSDTFTAKVADLGDALERDGLRTLNQAPPTWKWVPGGRP